MIRTFTLVIAAMTANLEAVAADLAASAETPERIDDRVVVRPEDTGQALINPGMGWTMHFYSNIIRNYGSKLKPSDALDDFPGCSVVYLRVPWAFLEPEEGRFDWSLLDTPAQRWISRGKRIAVRISCSESWMRYATPEWVEKAGAQGHNFTVGRGVDANGPFWEPNFDDPVFLKKLGQFLAAMARRYDNNPHVAFVDVGSLGVWGEGHTWASTKLEYSDGLKRRHIDLHLKHFENTLLAVSDDFIGPSNRVAKHPLTDYMLERGVTLRDDSICVQPPPNSWYHAELASDFWPRLPVILEHEHFGASQKRNAWRDGTLLLRAVEEYHASYLSIHWWPYEFLEENRNTIDKINRRLGYRLQLRQASWSPEIALGQPFEFVSQWANVGVAPCYPGGYVAVALKDDQGGIVSTHVADTLNVRDLKVGPPDEAPTRDVSSRFTVAAVYRDGPRRFARSADPGTYGVYISVGRLDGTPVIALPLPHGDGQRRYRIGRVRVNGS